MNHVTLVGRISNDVKTYEGASVTTKFNVACDRKYKKDGDQQTADFISCVAFGKTAEFIAKWFKKGMRIGITGRIQTGNYTNRDGQKVYTTDVVVEDAEFVESKNASAGQQTQQTAPPPQYQAPQQPQQQYQAPPQQYQQAPAQNYQQAPQPYQQQPQYQQPPQNQEWMNIPPGQENELPFN